MRHGLLIGMLLLLISVLSFTACGGGCGGNDSQPPTKATVKIMASGSLSTGTLIAGVDVTLNLPAGVTVKATADTVHPSVYITDAGAVTASGVAAANTTLALATYTAASSSPGKVVINLVNPNGFSVGEFVTVSCDIAAGAAPTTQSFSVSNFKAVGLDGAVITGLTAGLTADLQ